MPQVPLGNEWCICYDLFILISRQHFNERNCDGPSRVLMCNREAMEGFGNFIAKGDRPGNSRDENPLETIWIIVDELEKTYKEPAPKSLDELRQ